MAKFEDVPMGKQEMAVLFSVSPRTPHMWWHRKELPEPDFFPVNVAPAWWLSNLLLWSKESGRYKFLSPEMKKHADRLHRQAVKAGSA